LASIPLNGEMTFLWFTEDLKTPQSHKRVCIQKSSVFSQWFMLAQPHTNISIELRSKMMDRFFPLHILPSQNKYTVSSFMLIYCSMVRIWVKQTGLKWIVKSHEQL